MLHVAITPKDTVIAPTRRLFEVRTRTKDRDSEKEKKIVLKLGKQALVIKYLNRPKQFR